MKSNVFLSCFETHKKQIVAMKRIQTPKKRIETSFETRFIATPDTSLVPLVQTGPRATNASATRTERNVGANPTETLNGGELIVFSNQTLLLTPFASSLACSQQHKCIAKWRGRCARHRRLFCLPHSPPLPALHHHQILQQVRRR